MDDSFGARPEVKPRQVGLKSAFETVPRHFAGDGDLITSHIIAALSSVFPDGEDFFITSVRHYRDDIADPVLRRQVAGFIGQEVTHGREHRAFNAHLDTVGYHTKLAERVTRKGLEFRIRRVPPMANLASTAALEHVTATMAELVMTSPETQESFGHEAVQHLFYWHALEESEHKAVAFDVYRAMGGSERMRIITMKMVRYGFVIGIGLQVIISLLLDPASYRPGALRKSWRHVRNQPLLSRQVWETLKAYERPGFHPSDIPNDDLVETWRERLFGANGSMAAVTGRPQVAKAS